ncbi:MAG: hypothetical protein J6R38_00235 [Alistipes sp.]|nr:hypothetical protein [Alistipes sp.]
MNIKKLLISAVLPVLFLTTAVAQEVEAGDNTPKKNDFTVAATVGYNSFTSVQALPGGQDSYSASAFSTNWSDKKLMVGIEGGWFMTDLWKLTLGGGLTFTNNPGYYGMDAIYNDETLILPGYENVVNSNSFGYNINLGVDRYFRLKGVKNLMLYAGVRAGYAYAVNEQYVPVEWLTKSLAETFNLRGALTFGVDYFVLPYMYVGLSVDPVCYTYGYVAYKPQAGMDKLAADNHGFSFLAAPTIKLGFKF